jgi:hypothetical protein
MNKFENPWKFRLGDKVVFYFPKMEHCHSMLIRRHYKYLLELQKAAGYLVVSEASLDQFTRKVVYEVRGSGLGIEERFLKPYVEPKKEEKRRGLYLL